MQLGEEGVKEGEGRVMEMGREVLLLTLRGGYATAITCICTQRTYCSSVGTVLQLFNRKREIKRWRERSTTRMKKEKENY